MSDTFEIGDVVKLNSGSPSMTVTYLRDDGKISCYWYSKDKSAFNFDSFPAPALTKAEP